MHFGSKLFGAAAVCTGAVVLLGTSAASATTPAAAKSGQEYFFLAIAGSSQSVVAHGLFTGGGVDDASHQNYDILHLGGGTLRINHPDAQSKFTEQVNPKSCFITFKITGKYTLSNGTGRFAGVTGNGTYQLFEEGILGRDKSGACSEQQAPLTPSGYVTASGPATIK